MHCRLDGSEHRVLDMAPTVAPYLQRACTAYTAGRAAALGRVGSARCRSPRRIRVYGHVPQDRRGTEPLRRSAQPLTRAVLCHLFCRYWPVASYTPAAAQTPASSATACSPSAFTITIAITTAVAPSYLQTEILIKHQRLHSKTSHHLHPQVAQYSSALIRISSCPVCGNL